MKQTTKKIAWWIIAFAPILFWFEMYKAWTTNYDENWGHFFLSFVISFVTIGLLITIRNDFQPRDKLKRLIRVYATLLATPITVGIIIFYQMTIPMQWKWSSSHVKDGKSYYFIKKKNYFQAENYIIIDNLDMKSDTIKAIVGRNGELNEIFLLNEGNEIILQLSDLKNLNDKQLKKLTEY